MSPNFDTGISNQMEILALNIEELDTTFERFRLIDPGAEAQMKASVKVYGQLSPVLTGKISNRKLLLVDGYKRFRAIKALKQDHITAYTLERPVTALKAMILTVNHEPSPCRELEEALLVQSLHHDDGLQQNEIALLCNRHKSWVSRRIALIERLSDDVREQLRLGLLTISAARELLRLPRGNQPPVLNSILENQLSSRQCRELVDVYLSVAQSEREAVLCNPPGSSFNSNVDCGNYSALTNTLLRCSARLSKAVGEKGVGLLNQQRRQQLNNAVTTVSKRCSSISSMIQSAGSLQ